MDENLDKTVELIPISTLKNILFDEKVFIEFLESKGQFNDIDVSHYVSSLNDYMELIIKTSNDIKECVFDKINTINQNYDFDKKYDYIDYSLDVHPDIDLNKVEIILNDDEVFNLFMNFYENEEYFGNIPLLDYLVSINNFVNTVNETENLSLNVSERIKFDQIKKKYSLALKRAVALDGFYIEKPLDKKFIEKIFSKVDFTKGKFSIAYSIYIELNKICTYDTNFLAYNQNIRNKEALDIYNKDVSTINEENNKIICSSWAIIYANLLIKCGFDARVCGSFHKYVQFDCDGTLMEADATQIHESHDGVYLEDIARCHMDLETAGFTCLEKDKDISEILKETAASIGYGEETVKKITSDALEKYKEKYVDEKLSINEKMKIILNIAINAKYTNFELMQYLKLLYKASRTNEDEISEFKFIVIKTDGDYLSGVVLSYVEDNEVKHIIFTEKLEILDIANDDLQVDVDSGKYVVVNNQKNIMGLRGSETNEHTRT